MCRLVKVSFSNSDMKKYYYKKVSLVRKASYLIIGVELWPRVFRSLFGRTIAGLYRECVQVLSVRRNGKDLCLQSWRNSMTNEQQRHQVRHG